MDSQHTDGNDRGDSSENESLKVDISRFRDPLAGQVAWVPLASGSGANFRTMKIVMAGPRRLEFRPTSGKKLFSLTMLLPLGVPIIFFRVSYGQSGRKGQDFIQALVNDRAVPELVMSGFLLLGILTVSLGCLLIFRAFRPIVFDKDTGYQWQGFGEPGQRSAQAIQLREIHAIQLVTVLHEGGSVGNPKSRGRPWHGYEMILVLKDGSRKLVVDHGSLEDIQRDAQTLATFLGVPVWDNSAMVCSED